MIGKHRGEKVLVVPASILVRMGFKEGINGSSSTEQKLKAIFDFGDAYFCDRARAEKDESLRQIIPYVIFKHDRAVFSYVRGKGADEKRLKGNRSIGIGGHINPVDTTSVDVSLDFNAYRRALAREINEEIEFFAVGAHDQPKPIAFINDNSNPVGRVHLGIVHLCELPSKCVRRKEEQISESGFLPLTELDRHSIPQTGGGKREQLESWSLLCVDYLTG